MSGNSRILVSQITFSSVQMIQFRSNMCGDNGENQQSREIHMPNWLCMCNIAAYIQPKPEPTKHTGDAEDDRTASANWKTMLIVIATRDSPILHPFTLHLAQTNSECVACNFVIQLFTGSC